MEKGVMVLLKVQHAGSNTSAQVHSGKKRSMWENLFPFLSFQKK